MNLKYEPYKIAQKFFESDYLQMIQRLLPRGAIWILEKYISPIIIQDVINGNIIQDTNEDGSNIIQDIVENISNDGNLLTKFFSCFAAELETFERDCWNLLNQTDPGVAVELLPDWENLLGIYNTCAYSLDLTLDQRQALSHVKFFYRGKIANAQFYIDIAEELGFSIIVVEYPSNTGARIFGQAKFGLEPFGGIGGWSNIKITIISGEPVDLLKCVINVMKPSHVYIYWEVEA